MKSFCDNLPAGERGVYGWTLDKPSSLPIVLNSFHPENKRRPCRDTQRCCRGGRKMKGKLPAIALFVTLSASASATFAETCVLPSGKTWNNRKGVQVTLEVSATGSVTGTYKAATGCGAGTSRPLTGFCDGYAVVFSISQPQCESITAWTGSYDHNSIAVLWHTVSADRPNAGTTHSGADTFIQEYIE